jgi:hypothetical protein
MKEISFEDPSRLAAELEKPPLGTVRSRGSVSAPTIRTFRGDVEGLVQREGITKTQIVMAEETRREERGEHRTVHENDSHLTQIILVLIGVLAIGVGIGAYVLIGVTPKQEQADAEEPRTERLYEVNIHNAVREQIIADTAVAFSKTSYSPKESRTVVFTTIKQGGKVRDATGIELLDALAITPIPERLSRSIEGKGALQIYGRTILDPLIGAIEFDVRSYPNAFAGMLEWERVMARDVLLVLYPKFSRNSLLSLEERIFSDERISGIDARVLKNDEGVIVLAYMFLDKSRLVITGNNQVLAMIVSGEGQPTAK